MYSRSMAGIETHIVTLVRQPGSNRIVVLAAFIRPELRRVSIPVLAGSYTSLVELNF